MGTQFSTSSVPFYQDTDTITITRRSALPNGTSKTSQIFKGFGDYQEASGQIYYDPSGVVQQADAVVFINPALAPIPSTLVGDYVSIVQNLNGVAKPLLAADGTPEIFEVVSQMLYTSPPPHLELTLKRGPFSYRGAPR